MRLSGTKTTAIHQYRGLGNQLWDLAGNRPSLDLRFADSKSLVDATTGTNLVDFTRASSGTYVGSDGLIKTATTNLLLRSEEFNDASWVKGANTTVTANYAISPIGTLGADRVQMAAGTGTFLTQSTTLIDGLSYRLSVYARSTTGSSRVALQASGANLQTFSLTETWQRVSVQFVASSTTSVGFDNDNVAIDILLWGAQLEQSSTVGEYVKTTSTINSAPRFDHDPTTGESLGLLVEEARTNLITDSSLTTIGALYGSTISSTTETNPEGIDFCRRLLSNAGSNATGHRIYINNTSANNITVSAFVKKDTHRYVYIGFGGASNSFTALFDIDPTVTGDRLLGEGGLGTHTNIDAGYQNFPNGWVRIWAVGTTSGTEGTTIGLSPNDSTFNITNWNAAGTEAIFIHGVQYEDNATFPTSYIPTEGTTVTRSADVASISGNNFGTTNLLSYSEEFDQASWTKVRSSITPNSIVAPDGTLTADKLVENTDNNTHVVDRVVSLAENVNVSYSFYVKEAERSIVRIQFINRANTACRAYFDVSTGTVSNQSNATGFIVDVGNGWYRCSISFNSGSGATTTSGLIGPAVTAGTPSYTGDGTSGIYIWGAQLEQSDVATPYVKSNVTWNSRASNATYYDSTGTIRKSSYNELLWSEEFNDASWSLDGIFAFGSGSTADAIAAPDGTMTADLLTEDTSTGFHDIRQGFNSYQSGVTYTWSVFFKAASGTRDFQIVLTTNAFPGNPLIRVNPTTGSIIDSTDINASVQPYPDGWYRASFSATADANGSDQVYLRLLDGVSGSYTGDGTSGIYLWGAQLEKGTYAGDYAKTEATAASTARNAAYLPDGNGNFVSAGPLLLEEQRTNLITDSSDIAGYFIEQNSTATADASTAPDGTTTADLIVPDTTLARHSSFSTSISFTADTTYSYSIFVKPNGYNWLQLLFTSGFNNPTAWVNFNLTGAGSFGFTGGSELSKSIQAYPNGWYRCTINATSGSSIFGGGPAYLALDSDRNSRDASYAGNNTSGIYVWGAQLEEGAYPSSCIPTYGIAATRSADVSTSTSGFGNSWYRQDEGTVFTDAYRASAVPSTDFPSLFDANDGIGTDNRVGIGYLTETLASQAVRVGGNQEVNHYSAGLGGVRRRRIAGGFKENDFYLITNGLTAQAQSDTSGAMPSNINQARIGVNINGVFQLNGAIRRLTYWQTRLPNETLQTITQ